jgi:hypothetical protein
LGAFAPFLLVNVPSRTTDALLYFNTAQAMLLCLHGAPLARHRQASLLLFLESSGVDGRLLRDLASLPVRLSESTGEFLLETHSYSQWLRFGKPLHMPEQLSSCLFQQVISRVDIGDALSALVDLAAASATGQTDTAAAALVYRLFYVLSAIARRAAKRPLEERQIIGALRHILSLASPALRQAAPRQEGALGSSLPELSDAATQPDVAPFLRAHAVQEEIQRHAEHFLATSHAELTYRLRAIGALLFALLGFVPEWLAATGVAVSIAAFISDPAKQNETLEGAAAVLIFAHDLGLDAAVLSIFQKQDHVYPIRGSAAFSQSRKLLAESVRDSVLKRQRDEDLERIIMKVPRTELQKLLKELLRLLPANSTDARQVPTGNAVERALRLLPILESAAKGGPSSVVSTERPKHRTRDIDKHWSYVRVSKEAGGRDADVKSGANNPEVKQLSAQSVIPSAASDRARSGSSLSANSKSRSLASSERPKHRTRDVDKHWSYVRASKEADGGHPVKQLSARSLSPSAATDRARSGSSLSANSKSRSLSSSNSAHRAEANDDGRGARPRQSSARAKRGESGEQN